MRFKRLSIIFFLLLALLFRESSFVYAEDQATEGVIPCTYQAPSSVSHYLSHLTDQNAFTTVTLERNETLELAVSEPAQLKGLFFDFYESPDSLQISFFDRDHVSFQTELIKDPGYLFQYPAPTQPAYYIQLSCLSGKVIFSELYAFTDGFRFPFPDAAEQADLLMILNEPGDELEQFGGLLAVLSKEHQMSVQIMYMTRADGYKTHQCISVLESLGVRRMPVWGTGSRPVSETEKVIYAALGGESVIRNKLVSAIRTYKPVIVLTLASVSRQERYTDTVIHDFVVSAVADASNPKRYPDLAAHTVQKCYALNNEGKTRISLDQSLISLDGETALSFSERLYQSYLEERVYRKKLPSELSFDLLVSSVGEDTGCNDLTENLNTAAFSAYVIPTPTPSPTPEPTITPTPTTAPTQSPTEEPTASPLPTEVPSPIETAPAALEAQDHGSIPPVFWLSFAVGTVLLLCLLFFLPLYKPVHRQKWLLIPIVLGTLLAVFLLIRSSKERSSAGAPAADVHTPLPVSTTASALEKPIPTETALPTQAVTDTPSPTETPAPTPSETPEPSPAVSPSYYLEEDGEEYHLDFENGHWWYKSRSLSIDVVRIKSTYPKNNGPLVYYVADIHMLDGTSYRSGVRRYTPPWKFARYEKAVLAITGDNMVSAEQTLKGCIIRKGIAYTNYERAATLIIEPDNMTLSVLRPKQFTTRELLDRGVRDTYSFGPILIENGEICSDVSKSRVRYPNPRCGIGMIEPGHWIAIVTDGRQKRHSMSINLQYFAELFKEQGCVLAYNLDGGSSTGMVFMGEALNQHSSGANSDGQRPWTDALMFGYSENVPSPDQPTKYTGYHY